MRKLAVLLAISTLTTLMIGFAAPGGTAFAGGGFDDLGYNTQARIFVGAADGTDGVLDGAVWGDPTFANDHLVMKWNAAWDACNATGNEDEEACAGAWTTNQWNGAVPGGSNTVWHYKIIWVGPLGEDSPYWADGGYVVWGNYETIMDHGIDLNSEPAQIWFAHATPNGLSGGR